MLRGRLSHYSDDDVQVVSGEEQLALWWGSAGGWQDAADTCNPATAYTRDVVQNWLSVPICHLSTFGLLGPSNQVYLPLDLHPSP